MRIRRKRGQSTIEYLVILSALIAAIITVGTLLVKPNLSAISQRAINRMGSTTVISTNMMP